MYARRVGTDTLVFLHLLGAFLFVGGSLAATVLRVAAIRAPDAAAAAVLLRAVRPAVPIVGAGFVLAVVLGFALVERIGLEYSAAWLSATFALLLWLLVVGAVAGRSDRRTRELAEKLALEGGPTGELRRRLVDPLNLLLNGSLLAATFAVVALMVFKPS
jgi:uncharacterized membrane protein